MHNSVSAFLKVFLPVSLFILVGIYSAYLYEKKLVIDSLESRQIVNVDKAQKYLQSRLHNAVLDLYSLVQQKDLKEYLQSGSDESLAKISSVFLGLAQGRPHYDQISLIDAHGKEISSVYRSAGQPQITESEKLADLRAHYYIKQLATGSHGLLHISFFDQDAADKSAHLRLAVKLHGKAGDDMYLVLGVEGTMFDEAQRLIHAGKTDVLMMSHENIIVYSSDRYVNRAALASEILNFVNLGRGLHAVDAAKDSYRFWKSGDLWTYAIFDDEDFKGWKVYMLLPGKFIDEEIDVIEQRFKVTFLFSMLVGLIVSILYYISVSKVSQLSGQNKKNISTLSEKESLLGLFITHVPAAVAMVDKDMRYMALSNRWLEDFRLVEDVIGKSHYDVFPGMPLHWRAIYERCFDGAVEYCDEEKLELFNGVTDWVRWEVRPWYSAENDIGGLVILMELITERKQASAARDEFISKVSHELRTPLTAIMGSMKLLQANVFGKLDSQAVEVLNIAERNSQRLLDLVNDLLDMQKIRLGEIGFHLKNVPIRSVIDQSIKQVSSIAKERNIHIILNDESNSSHVFVDEKRLIQVVVNLLLNAINYTPVASEVKLEITRVNKEIMFSVEDSGTGVPEEIKQDIFNEFVQDEEGSKRSLGGAGLGLAIARALIEKLGGNISFYNREHGGAVFYFTLPGTTTKEAVNETYVKSLE